MLSSHLYPKTLTTFNEKNPGPLESKGSKVQSVFLLWQCFQTKFIFSLSHCIQGLASNSQLNLNFHL